MGSKSRKMAGTATFNTYVYLLNGAGSFAETAKEHDPGSNYCRVSAVLFSAFAIEAHLNHIGNAMIPDWENVERKLSWDEKLDRITQQLNITPDLGKRPFQTAVELFNFRNALAHGKTVVAERKYKYNVPGDDASALDPDWLKKYWSDEAVARVLADTRQIIKLLHDKAGFEPYTLNLMSHANFEEEARKPIPKRGQP